MLYPNRYNNHAMTIRGDKIKTDKWTELLFEDLKDPDRAAGYLNECFVDSPETFLLGLRYVIEARGGVGQLARKAGLGRESLYKLLSGKQGARLTSVIKILNALGIETTFIFKTGQKKTKRTTPRLVGRKAA